MVLLKTTDNYYKGITPSNPEFFNIDEYKKLVEISKEYFGEGKIQEFSSFFMEGQYFIQLWAAHLILEYGNPDDSLKKGCIEMIENYSDNPLNLKISPEEQELLKNFK